MIDDIKTQIAKKLKEIYPGYKVYDEDIPQNFHKPSFLLELTDFSYEKRLSNVFNGDILFVVTLIVDEVDQNSKCSMVMSELARQFDYVGDYRVLNREFTITDGVLKMVFSIKYSEMKETDIIYMKEIISKLGLGE